MADTVRKTDRTGSVRQSKQAGSRDGAVKKAAVHKKKVRKKKAVPAGKRAATSHKTSGPGKSGSTAGAAGSSKAQKAGKTAKNRDEIRARQREERRRKVRRQKILLTASVTFLLLCAVLAVVLFMPSMRLSRALARGSAYVEAAEYENAQIEYEKALDIDATSVKAYWGLAENYLAQKDAARAESELYLGWENTQDESLLNYYCTVVLNEAVAEINDKNVTLDTVDKCIQILEINPENTDALSLTDTCYQRLFTQTEEEECRLFYEEESQQESCQYEEYAQLVERLAEIYRTKPSESLRMLLKEYAVIDQEWVWLSLQHVESYRTLLATVNEMLADEEVSAVMACLDRTQEIEAYFEEAFTEFASGNYEYAREIVSSEEYMQLRDSFIQENSGCWEGSIYIPVNQEAIVLHRTENGCKFSFAEKEEGGNSDVITIWGSKQEDDGVQRSVISYEPAQSADASEHTEYTVQYLYSNVKVNGQYVPQMNYRFDTKVTTAEGITTTAIGDWGGEHEWEIDY